jgi:tetratricopeptide (TPR) repeat protein
MKACSITSVVLLLASTSVAWAIPGYHIGDDSSAQTAARQYAGNCEKFRAVAYQAYLDKSLWRLALAAHESLQQKPDDPQRECSFATVYWQAQSPVGVHEAVPAAARAQLQGLYNEAVEDTKEAARRMPASVAAHLNYGYYLQYFVMGMGKVPSMLREYERAVALAPDMGYAHAMLTNAYFGSGDESQKTVDKIIAEGEKAVALDPRQTEPYFLMAAASCWANRYKAAQSYLSKYLKLAPDATANPGVAPMQQSIQQHLSKG